MSKFIMRLTKYLLLDKIPIFLPSNPARLTWDTLNIIIISIFFYLIPI